MSFAYTKHVGYTEKKRPAKNLLPSTEEGREHLSHLVIGKRCKRAALMLEEHSFPPGFNTRAASLRALRGSRMKHRLNVSTTESKGA